MLVYRKLMSLVFVQASHHQKAISMAVTCPINSLMLPNKSEGETEGSGCAPSDASQRFSSRRDI